jgi:branched-chain amino acid aminotransferase
VYLHNNKITAAPIAHWDNRAFKYGDAFFETMLYHNGQIPLLALHIARAQKTLQLLQMQPPEGFGTAGFEVLLADFLRQQGHTTAKVRISFWRNGGGTYFPIENTTSYIVEAAPITTPPFELNNKGLTLDIYRETYKNTDFLANLKTVGCLTYTLASMWVRQQNVADAILLNHHGRIAECTSSNIFIITDTEIITPPLTEGCLDGVMRRHLLNILPKKGFKIKEQPIDIAQLNTADEIYTTNALGIRWVGQVKEIDKTFSNEAILEIIETIVV